LLILALAAVVQRRDRVTWALVAIIVASTLIALGKNFIVYRVLYDLLPGFKKFRVPVMILAVQQLAVILLAARGLDAVFLGRLRIPRALLGLIATLGLLGIVAGSVAAGPVRDTVVSSLESMARSIGRPVPPPALLLEAADLAVSDALRLGAILLASVLALLATRARRIPAMAGIGIVALLLFVDLWRVNQPLLHPENHLSRVARSASGPVVVPSNTLLKDAGALVDYTRDSELAAWLKSRSPRPRVLPLGGLESDNWLASQGIVSLGGYHPAKLKIYEDVRARLFEPGAPQLSLARLFSAEWLVTPAPLGAATLEAIGQLGLPVESEPAWSGTDGVVYAVVDPLPRIRVVSRVTLEQRGADTTGREPEAAVLDRVASPGFNPAREVILSATPDPMPQPGAEAASVTVLEEGYNSLRVRVDLPAAGILVVADPWYPEWEVQVDGKSARLLRANYAQRAVALPAGAHEIVFRYAADSYVAGRRLAGAGWLLILAGFIAPPIIARRRPSRGDQEAA
jgi:hypothetical protein